MKIIIRAIIVSLISILIFLKLAKLVLILKKCFYVSLLEPHI